MLKFMCGCFDHSRSRPKENIPPIKRVVYSYISPGTPTHIIYKCFLSLCYHQPTIIAYKKNHHLFFRCHNMGFPCERVRHKIEHRENYIYTQWSDNIVDDRLHATTSTKVAASSTPTNDSTGQFYTLQSSPPINAHYQLQSQQQSHQQQPHQNHYNHQPIDINRKPDRHCWPSDFVLATKSCSPRPEQNPTAIRPNANGDNDGEHLSPANGAPVSQRQQHQPIGRGIAKRITQLISFNPGHQGSTPSLAPLPPSPARTATATTTATATPTSTTSTTSTTTTTTSTSTSVTSHSQYLVRQSLCLYAASSFILVLCYFATSAAAAEVVHPM